VPAGERGGVEARAAPIGRSRASHEGWRPSLYRKSRIIIIDLGRCSTNQTGQARGDGERHGHERWQEKARKANPVRLIGPNDPQCFALEMDDKEDECHHPE
jgi:hypothetical protein